MIIYVSLLVALVGAIVYIVTANSKVAQLALYAWACGLLAFLLQLPAHTVGILGK